jgi:excisionase family DNA binding protein
MPTATAVQLPDPRIEPTISIQRARALTGLGRDKVYEAIRAGIIPSIRVGQAVRIPTARLLEEVLGLRVPELFPPLPDIPAPEPEELPKRRRRLSRTTSP